MVLMINNDWLTNIGRLRRKTSEKGNSFSNAKIYRNIQSVGKSLKKIFMSVRWIGDGRFAQKAVS
jgi:hypothetical protein